MEHQRRSGDVKRSEERIDMIFGMPTLLELNGLRACAELCAALGLQFIEINMNMPAYQLERLDVGEMRDIANRCGIGFTFHLDENLDIADFNSKVKKAYVDTVRDTIHLAREIGAPIVNMHMARGVYFTLPSGIAYLYERYWEEYAASLIAFRDVCTDAVGHSGIRILIENTDGFLPFQQRGMELLLQSSAFGLTIDVGHDSAAMHIDAPFYALHAHRTQHMHLHDVSGTQAHLALGTGTIDVVKWLCIARENAMRVVLETKTVEGLKISAQYALGMEGKNAEKDDPMACSFFHMPNVDGVFNRRRN